MRIGEMGMRWNDVDDDDNRNIAERITRETKNEQIKKEKKKIEMTNQQQQWHSQEYGRETIANIIVAVSLFKMRNLVAQKYMNKCIALLYATVLCDCEFRFQRYYTVKGNDDGK